MSLLANTLIRRQRILVVDDNPAIHADFLKILSPHPVAAQSTRDLEQVIFGDPSPASSEATFDLDSAYQGQEAFEMVRKSLSENRPYALAFVDVRMPPGWDGIETVSRIWNIYPKLQVVICTAYSDYSWEEMRASLGQPNSLVVLKKPFDNIEVQQLAHSLTRKWELDIQAEQKMDDLEAIVQQRTSDLQAANKELKRSEERFSKAFQTSPVAMAIHSLAGHAFVDVNERMQQLAGFPKSEMLGRCATDFLQWSNPRQLDDWCAALLRNEAVRDQNIALASRSGAVYEVRVSLSLLTLSCEQHALIVIQDMTEHNLLERKFNQAQKMEAVGQLAAGVAHDFNNILTIIQGYAGAIGDETLSDRPPKEIAEIILHAAKRASDLTRQLLTFSHKQVMQFRRLDLNETVRDTQAIVGRLVGEHIQIQFDPDSASPSVHADPNMIEQIILNLAVNARDAMPDGGVIRLATSLEQIDRGPAPSDPEPRSGKFVRLTFSDTGCGMDPAILGQIFEPFFTTKGEGKGTGLGLASVDGIVRQHRGWIEVNSRLGQGTTFQIYFPLCVDSEELLKPVARAKPLQSARETILVAEDEIALREMIARGLSRQGYKVLTAASGPEAIHIYKESTGPIDLVLTDIVMPGGMMGGELAQRLRALDPKLKIAFTSGYSPNLRDQDRVLIDETNFLPKPFSLSELARFVRTAIEAKS